MKIDAYTQLNLVIGHPIRHSQSPALHQDLYQERKINAVTLAIENPSLAELTASIKNLRIRLTAVTLPYKTEILPYVDVQSDEVQALGAANTLILEKGKIHAYNTDIAGIRAALSGSDLQGKKILILGAGGAARAAAYCLKDHELFYFNRNQEHARILSKEFGGRVIDEHELSALTMDLIIHCTPVGMNADATPLPGYRFLKNQIVFDMVYTPEQTRLLREASEAGARTISGKIMLIAQAKKQMELAYGALS
jgi:shikimate dehydrogenase